MYAPETLLTKYLRSSRQNTKLKEKKYFQVSVNTTIYVFHFYLNKTYIVVFARKL